MKCTSYGSLDISSITSYLKNNTNNTTNNTKPVINNPTLNKFLSKPIKTNNISTTIPTNQQPVALDEDFVSYQGKSYNMMDQNHRSELAKLLNMPQHFLRKKFIRYIYKKDITLDQVFNKSPINGSIYPNKGSIIEVPYGNHTYMLSYFALEEVGAKYHIPNSSATSFQTRKLIYSDPAMQVRLILSRYDITSNKTITPIPINVIKEAELLTKSKYNLALQHFKNKKVFKNTLNKLTPTDVEVKQPTLPVNNPVVVPTYVKVNAQSLDGNVIEVLLPVFVSNYNTLASVFNTTVDNIKSNISNLKPIN